MTYNFANWYFGWGWFIWLGFIFLMFSSVGTGAILIAPIRNTPSLKKKRLIFSTKGMHAAKSPGTNMPN